MTRAKDRLFLSYAFMRMRYGDTEPSVPSSFLQDIPQELIEGAHPFQGRRVSLQTSSAGERGAASEGVSQGPQFRAGQTVRHSAFGEGLVIESRQDGADQIVSVVFADVGLKRLLADVAPLEIVDG
jgi:DNA helicase-2/ATP-dependent DNA helicase PcrA